MSLLTALLAFVPGALIARPEPEPESLKAMAELVDEIAVLKEKLRICEAARDAARADRDQSDAQLRGMQQQGVQMEWRHCTCVPGRYDALRQKYPRVFDAGHSHGA